MKMKHQWLDKNTAHRKLFLSNPVDSPEVWKWLVDKMKDDKKFIDKFIRWVL